MFNNIGRKIKALAKVLCWIGIIASILGGIGMIAAGSSYTYSFGYGYSSGPSVLVGVLTIIFGSLFSWIGSFFAYGFGQLIEDTEEIRESIRSGQ